jgi:hypothetical protein
MTRVHTRDPGQNWFMTRVMRHQMAYPGPTRAAKWVVLGCRRGEEKRRRLAGRLSRSSSSNLHGFAGGIFKQSRDAYAKRVGNLRQRVDCEVLANLKPRNPLH